MSSEKNETPPSGGGHIPEQTNEDQLATALDAGHRLLRDGRAEDAAESLDDALFLARQLGDDAAEAQAAGLLAQAEMRLGASDEAARHAAEALGIARARRDMTAAEHFQQLLLMARSTPEEISMSAAFGDGRAAIEAGEPARALESLEKSFSFAEKAGHKVALGATTQLLAEAHLALENKDEALRFVLQAQALAAELKDEAALKRAEELQQRISAESDPLAAGIANDLSWGQQALAKGDVERGIRHLERVVERALEEGEPVPEASAQGLLAQARIELGQYEQARHHGRRAAEIARELGHEDAAESFDSLVAMASAGPENRQLAQAIQEGTVAMSAGDHEKAVTVLEAARTLEGSNVIGETLITGLLVQAYLATGRSDDARKLASNALEVSEKRGDETAAAHFRELLDGVKP